MLQATTLRGIVSGEMWLLSHPEYPYELLQRQGFRKTFMSTENTLDVAAAEIARRFRCRVNTFSPYK